MIIIYILVIILMIILIGLKFMFSNKSKTIKLKKGQISGMVYNKFTKMPVKDAVVKLGKLDSENGKHNFTTEKDLTCLTNKEGKFIFENIEIKSYWVYAESMGKKVLKIVKLNNEIDRVDDVLLLM